MKLEKLIEKAIVNFDWSDYGLNNVAEARSREWAVALSGEIVKAMLLTQLRLDGEAVKGLERA